MLCPFNERCLGRRQSLPPGSTTITSSSFDPSSSSSDSGSFSSGSQTTFTSTPAFSSSTSSFSPTSQPQTSTLFSTGLTTSTPSLSTTRSRPSSSSPPSSSTLPPTSSSDFLFSTFTSSFVSEVNGSPTTIVTPIVTALRSSSQSLSSSHTSIIAGSAVAGIALLILALATLFCLRRRGRRRQQRYWALSLPKRLPSRTTFLAEEIGDEMDLPFPSPPFASLDQPDPFATHSSQRNSSAAGSVGSDGGGSGGALFHPRRSFARSQSPSSYTHANVSSAPFPSSSSSLTPPRLLRARASESGSIFHESVWPPPSAASQLMDPLTYPSQSVDLARVVTDVMGPPELGPLLLLQPNHSSQEQGQGQEQEQGALNPSGEGERRGADNWSPRSDLHSSPSSSRPSSPPLPPRPKSESESEPPLRPPSTPWLSRPLNPSPKGSPLQRTLPL